MKRGLIIDFQNTQFLGWPLSILLEGGPLIYNMAKNQDTGNRGEALAKAYLEKKGYQILETNWRYSRAEIDLIALDGDILVFIEVKTRRSDQFGKPEAFVNSKKESLIIAAASAYMEEKGHEGEIRFDVIGILLPSNTNFKLEHYPDAFFPGLA